MLFYDLHYLLYIFVPTALLGFLCQQWVKSSFHKWSGIANSRNMTGADAASAILRDAGVEGVRIERVEGFLSDHYDPRSRVVRLSPKVHSGRSIAAVAIAAHEVGHAVQHARAYAPLALRNAAVPMANIAGLGYGVLGLGAFLGGLHTEGPGRILIMVGVLGLAGIALFQLITLPVEFDASRRAMQHLPALGISDPREAAGVRNVLTAAAMTYVAALVTSLVTLLYWAYRLGLFGGQRND